MEKFKTIIFAIAILISPFIVAQDELERIYTFNVQSVSGDLLTFGTKRLENIKGKNVKGIDLGFEIPTTNFSGSWPYFFKYPKLGLNFTALDMGNDTILGNAYALYPNLQFEIFKHKAFGLNLRAGAGAAYVDKTFRETLQYKNDGTGDIDFDHSNSAISNHLNVFITLGANAYYQIAPSLKLVTEFRTFHISNGNLNQPNGGLNMISSAIGLSYSPNKIILSGRKYCCVPDLPKKWHWEFTLSGGNRALYYKVNDKFIAGSMTAAYVKQYTNQLKIGYGLDYFYDGVYSYVNYDQANKYRRTYINSDKFSNRFRAGLSIQPELVLGRFSFGYHAGIYIFNPIRNLEPFNKAANGDYINNPKGLLYLYDIDKEDGWLYNRIAAKFRINEHLFLNWGMVMHLSNTEFIEWGLGYRL